MKRYLLAIPAPLVRPLWRVLGVMSLLLAIIGVVLPLLPTTPFLLLSAFAFERSSERLHNWLVTHARFGPPIAMWRRYGAISNRSKRIAVAAMAATLAISIATGVPLYIILVQAVVLMAVGTFLLTRPTPPE